MEFIGSIIDILKSIYQGFDYFRSLNENIGTLNGKMEELSARKNDLKRKLEVAEVRRGKKPKTEVQVWLKNVEKMTTEVRDIESQIQQGRFPNYLLRTRLSKLAESKIREVAELQEKGRFSGTLFVDPVPNTGMIIPTTTLVGKTTAEKTLETIWECLMHVEIGKISVYGMGGIGKTTIMKKINNRLIEKGNLFDNIIWVTVSKDFNLDKIQNDIAKELNLYLSKVDDEMRKAAKLFQRLKQMKFVIILDDMWDAFPLERVGIPTPNKENGCKLVLTTRSLDVCRGMESQRSIKVESLSKEEAWELFKHKVGDHVKLAPEVEQIAMLVAQECACLPLAIITVGTAMREIDDIREWRNALNELRDSTVEIKGMEDEVFGRLIFSYKRLRNDRLRECFLFFALYPEDSNIYSKEITEYWIAEGLVEDVRNREMQLDKGYVILKELENACMLENVVYYGDKCVKMHDLIRDMAINITRERHRSLVKTSVSLAEFPKNEKWMENVERIYLMDNDIQVLSGQPKCPKLLTLLLKRNHLLVNIQDSFFEQMHNLKILDLSSTEVEYLPESVSELKNLHALLLHSCGKLRKVPSLAKLKELRVLDLSSTMIEELPQGMDEAFNLRRINLSHTGDLQIFSSGILPKLSLLEDLLMLESRWKWPTRSIEISGGAGVEDIISLTRLSNIDIHLEDFPGWINYIRSQRWKLLKSFHFIIGSVHTCSSDWNKKVNIGGCNIVCQESSLVFPDDTQYLHIDNCITQLSELSNLKDLKHLEITNCNGIEEGINMEVENTLSSLEKLYLADLPSLRTICKGIIPCVTLTSLKELFINGCPKMNNLLPLGLFQHLQNLEVISVRNCELMEEILVGGEIGEKENEEKAITFPKLRDLFLSDLPKLRRIYIGLLICNSLRTIDVISCPKLKKPICAPHLEVLRIVECPFVKNLSSFVFLHNLQNLKEIQVGDCEQMEEILPEEEASEASNSNVTLPLPRLEKLELQCLPELKRICKREWVCDSLRSIFVRDCPHLKKLPFSLGNLPTPLKKIKGEKEWWDTLEWDDLNIKNLLQPHFSSWR